MKIGRKLLCAKAAVSAFVALAPLGASASDRHDGIRSRHTGNAPSPTGHAIARHGSGWTPGAARTWGTTRHVPTLAVHGPGPRAYHSGPAFRVWVGPSYYYGGGPYWPYYYPPAVVYRAPPAIISLPPATPPVYVERQSDPQAEAPTSQNWYWCQSGKAYYPQVTDCPEGWIPVAAQPTPAN